MITKKDFVFNPVWVNFFNLRKKIQGNCDFSLTDMGIRYAKIAGKYFADNGIYFNLAYSSIQEKIYNILEFVTNNKCNIKRIIPV